MPISLVDLTMRINPPLFSSYLDGVKWAYGSSFEKLDRSIARRHELYYEFRDRSRKATTKRLKAMWNNLSLGQKRLAEMLQEKKFAQVVLIYAGYIVYASLFVLALGAVKNWVI